ncbi:MAG: crotonase/enoyl-CoA hydratase family protein [Gammaproteobacteria bacterium]
MLIKIENPARLLRQEELLGDTAELTNLDLRFDERQGILWKYISARATPYFSHELLDDIRTVQNRVRNRENGQGRFRGHTPVRYVVFASHRPGVFSLGGDLRLFRQLIARRDRNALFRYARKATDAVYYHAANFGQSMSFSLVQGIAMGGGFEAALAGNVLVAEKGSRLGFPEVLFGLFPGMGAYTLLRRRVDAATAERLILSARNYEAEELHAMGVVDVLCEPGEGEDYICSYVSRQSSRPGAVAFRQAINRTNAIDREELYGIADAWVETAMTLPDDCLRRIDRLVANQGRNFGEAPVPAFAPIAHAG